MVMSGYARLSHVRAGLFRLFQLMSCLARLGLVSP
jgi:hypothetical protein